MAATREARLETFLGNWRDARAADQLAPRLARFLSAYHPPRAPIRPIVKPRELDPKTLERFVAAVRDPLEAHRARGNLLNPWAVAGVRRREVANSAILASFWSPQTSGDLARRFLDAFCRRIDDPDVQLPTSAELALPFAIRTEHCPMGEACDRVDITIEGATFVLGIEVKIDAGEGPEQLERYVASVKRWSRRCGNRGCVVFLSPMPSNNSEVLCANWRDVASAARSALKDAGDASSVQHFMLDAFVQHIRGF